MSESQAYPLSWPQGWPRTPSHKRKRASFGKSHTINHGLGSYKAKKNLSIADGVKRVMSELSAYTKRGHLWRIPPDSVVISSDLRVRKSDGLPVSSQRTPEDPGVAVYFELDGKKQVIPCDRYDRIADNLAGVAATLDSLRALERHGTGVMERAFTGFAALEHNPNSDWRQILEMGPRLPNRTDQEELDAAERQFKILASKAHPDKPTGSKSAMLRLNSAREQARRELANG